MTGDGEEEVGAFSVNFSFSAMGELVEKGWENQQVTYNLICHLVCNAVAAMVLNP